MSNGSHLTSPLSPPRPSSRPSSRGSGRSSPSVTLGDDTVAIRHQMSTLKHNIRHQQAQLATLENTVLRGPRPLPPGIFSSPPMSPAELDPSLSSSSSSNLKLARRSSYDALQGLAGPESGLPLPRRDLKMSFGEENGIREGIPTGAGSGYRASSPTRTLSRIPVSSVGNARALAGEDMGSSSQAGSLNVSTTSTGAISPRRASFAPGNTTKVLADLQAGVLNAKNALENTKAQLRVSQRQVSQLTRQTEDLKEVRERLRLENEGLNNVVARKERLLQEVLDRARKAEAEVITLKSQLKNETSTSKKTIREMETSLTECTARTQKAEREYVVLRDSIKGLVSSFERDAVSLREEMARREEKLKGDSEEMGRKYRSLLEAVRKERESGGLGEVRWLLHENKRIAESMEVALKEEMQDLRGEVDRHAQESDEAIQTARYVSSRLPLLIEFSRQLLMCGRAQDTGHRARPTATTHATSRRGCSRRSTECSAMTASSFLTLRLISRGARLSQLVISLFTTFPVSRHRRRTPHLALTTFVYTLRMTCISPVLCLAHRPHRSAVSSIHLYLSVPLPLPSALCPATAGVGRCVTSIQE
ncbi:hypothetical protein C8Q80DRAFT_1205159 [Daedaleopsis nitida]|nr:hypothetical protein C8Q80DRAFT_1205159 [Daedaleopsis nitida]